MAIHLVDSKIFSSSWSSDALRGLFDEPARIAGWLRVLVVLAETQAELGLIPAEAAREIRRVARVEELDWEDLKSAYNETGHSTFGLIRQLAARCRGAAGEYLHFGATVQDISDTALVSALCQAWGVIFRELHEVEGLLARMASTHRDTVMAGRTHGQLGAPITFGLKAATWMLELRDLLDCLREGYPRLSQGQLCGAVGSLAGFGDKGLELQLKVMRKMGLTAPLLPWTSSRGRLVEFAGTLARTTSAFDRIGHEIYNLQRNEIGELCEGWKPGNVGSVTMPQKRNPEISEHLGTLSRLVRHQYAALLESLVHDHERDGRSWKVEWAIYPVLVTQAGTCVSLGRKMLGELSVDPARMRANLGLQGGFAHSETVTLRLAASLGPRSARELMLELCADARVRGLSLPEVLKQDPRTSHLLSPNEVEKLSDFESHAGHCAPLVDQALSGLEARRRGDVEFLERIGS